MLYLADHRGLDEREVWSWPVSRALTWAKYYAARDSELDGVLAGLGVKR